MWVYFLPPWLKLSFYIKISDIFLLVDPLVKIVAGVVPMNLEGECSLVRHAYKIYD